MPIGIKSQIRSPQNILVESGRAQGRRQLPAQERATGKKGEWFTMNQKTNKRIKSFVSRAGWFSLYYPNDLGDR